MKSLRQLGTPVVISMALFFCAASTARAAAVTKTGAFYTIKIQTAGQGDSVVATITVTGIKGYHCNLLYPWKLTIGPAEGIAFEKDKLKAGPNEKKDAAKYGEDGIVFAVPYKLGANAAKDVTATLKLSLCDDKQCQMESVALSWKAR